MRALTLMFVCFLAFTPVVVAVEGAPVPVTMTVAGKPALKLNLMPGWTSVANGDVLTLVTPQKAPHIQVWPVTGVAKVDDAVAKIAATVVSQVKDFTAASTRDLTVARAPAKQLIGTGTEADDGDPSNAEITVFAVEGVVYVLCAHGEGDGTSKCHDAVLGVLASISAP